MIRTRNYVITITVQYYSYYSKLYNISGMSNDILFQIFQPIKNNVIKDDIEIELAD